MLIRSQSKEALYNLNTISGVTYQEIYDYNRGKETTTNHEVCIDYGGLSECIGTYSTREKALKVLDMIQENYLSRMKLDGGFDARSGCYVQPNFWVLPKLFQMPQDSEVQP